MTSRSLETTYPLLTGGQGYAPLTEGSVREYLQGLSTSTNLLGGPAETWTVREVGDGNLNLVFVIRGRGSAVVVKQAQALPYVRLVVGADCAQLRSVSDLTALARKFAGAGASGFAN